MAFRKYQSVEKTDLATPKEHKAIESNLHKLGKSSAADLSDDDRRSLDKSRRV